MMKTCFLFFGSFYSITLLIRNQSAKISNPKNNISKTNGVVVKVLSAAWSLLSLNRLKGSFHPEKTQFKGVFRLSFKVILHIPMY